MANYITVDGGTTNTRISLLCDFNIVDTVKFNVGAGDVARNGADLGKTVSNGINELLQRHKLSEADIEIILASGMITSEYGLVELPHLTAPCGINELADGMFFTEFKEITSIPFAFIRGVRISDEDPLKTDMMRGEEAELYGIQSEDTVNCLYVLPGTHFKSVYVDEFGRIADISTAMTGEMISAAVNGTILKDIVDLGESEPDEEYLCLGYEYALKKGINEALFKLRILKNLFGATVSQLYGFFMGVMLSCEVKNIITSSAKSVVIGGKKQLRLPMEYLIRRNSDKNIIAVSDEVLTNAPALGALKIYKAREYSNSILTGKFSPHLLKHKMGKKMG